MNNLVVQVEIAGRVRRLSPVLAGLFFLRQTRKRGWTAEGLIHDLQLMGTLAVWQGQKTYAAPQIVRRLETHQEKYPDLSFFVVTLPRQKGNRKSKSSGFPHREIGTEEGLPER